MEFHRLTNIDKSTRKGQCSICGPVSIHFAGVTPNGVDRWKCWTKIKYKRRPWLHHRKEACERCGFIPEHPSQLDIDHMDGNRDNNDPLNLRTLCANCHRLKTFLNQDWIKDKPLLIDPSNF